MRCADGNERGSKQPQLMVFIAVSVCDVGVLALTSARYPQKYPRAGWLENSVQQNQIVAMANFRHAHGFEPGPTLGFELANGGSIAYARIAQ